MVATLSTPMYFVFFLAAFIVLEGPRRWLRKIVDGDGKWLMRDR